MSDPLFQPLQAGALVLPNRIVMSPLTRCRASTGRVPNSMMAAYYAQRASFGLIIAEATAVCPMGVGYPNTPGIWSAEQIEGWRGVTRAVHDAGGQIVLQLWHVGRISDPCYLKGELPVAPSAIRPAGHVRLVRPTKEYATPRALAIDELPAILEAYRQGAGNAQVAGFDGVEIHGANGYLLDQFLQDSSNHRTDDYGGSIENRARLMLEVTDAVSSVWGAERVGMHISPRGDAHDMGDSNPTATFGYVARELGHRGLAFLFAREPLDHEALGPQLKEQFGGVFIANQGLTGPSARDAITAGLADAVAFGQAAIATPDLVERLRVGAPWNAPDPGTFYGDGPAGYLDYPQLATSGSAR